MQIVTTQKKPTVDQLKEVRLLKCFSDSELSSLIEAGTTQLVEAHTNVVIEGEMSWGIYFVIEGMMGVFKTNHLTNDSYDVAQLSGGNFFGEMSLVDDQPRSATVRSYTDCTLFMITKESFENFLSKSSDLRLRFQESCIKNLVHRLRELDENYIISQYQLWKTTLRKEVA